MRSRNDYGDLSRARRLASMSAHFYGKVWLIEKYILVTLRKMSVFLALAVQNLHISPPFEASG